MKMYKFCRSPNINSWRHLLIETIAELTWKVAGNNNNSVQKHVSTYFVPSTTFNLGWVTHLILMTTPWGRGDWTFIHVRTVYRVRVKQAWEREILMSLTLPLWGKNRGVSLLGRGILSTCTVWALILSKGSSAQTYFSLWGRVQRGSWGS